MKISLLAFGLLFLMNNSAHAELAKFLYLDKDAIQARADIIEQAKNEIIVEYFAVTEDDISIGGISLLCDASKRGVKVKVLLDAFASHVEDSTIMGTYTSCKDKDGNTNIEFKKFNPLALRNLTQVLNRDHEKLLAADGESMIIGGRNVDAKYFGLDKKRNFKDLDIMLKGNIVAEARTHFFNLWEKNELVVPAKMKRFDPKFVGEFCNENDDNYSSCMYSATYRYNKALDEVAVAAKRMERINRTMKAGKGAVELQTGKDWFKDAKEVNGVSFLANDSKRSVDGDNMLISDGIYSVVKNAKNKVLILSPYLIPTPRARQLFTDLIKKGVTITIITNSLKSTDNLFAQAGYKKYKNEMIELGIELYEYDLVDTTHAKTAVIDDETVLIGTYNLDSRSSIINREIGIVIKDTLNSGLGLDLTKIIDKFKEQSILVGKDKKHMNIDLQNNSVGILKKGATEALKVLVPLIEKQL